MEDAEIETVEQLFGYFLYSGDDFEDWLRKSCGVKPYIARKIVENMQEKAEKVCAAGGRGDGIPARTTAKEVTPVKDTVVIDKFRSAPLQDLKTAAEAAAAAAQEQAKKSAAESAEAAASAAPAPTGASAVPASPADRSAVVQSGTRRAE